MAYNASLYIRKNFSGSSCITLSSYKFGSVPYKNMEI